MAGVDHQKGFPLRREDVLCVQTSAQQHVVATFSRELPKQLYAGPGQACVDEERNVLESALELVGPSSTSQPRDGRDSRRLVGRRGRGHRARRHPACCSASQRTGHQSQSGRGHPPEAGQTSDSCPPDKNKLPPTQPYQIDAAIRPARSATRHRRHGGAHPLRDEGLAYAERLRQVGFSVSGHLTRTWRTPSSRG